MSLTNHCSSHSIRASRAVNSWNRSGGTLRPFALSATVTRAVQPHDIGNGSASISSVEDIGLQVASTSSKPQQRAAPLLSSFTSTDRIGVIVVDHGSRRKESNLMLEEFAVMFQERSGRTIVEPAHMELAEPSIATAFERCVARGATKVIISPYFLSRGKHIQVDIPALAEEAASRHPGVDYVVAEPIGLDPLMAQIIDNRVKAATSQWRDDRPLLSRVVDWVKTNLVA